MAAGNPEARVHFPPTCRGVGMQCANGDECRSGRCIPKSDGAPRCARTTSNRKNKLGGKGSPSLTCTFYANGCPSTTIKDAITNASDSPDAVVIDGNTASTCNNSYDADSSTCVYP